MEDPGHQQTPEAGREAWDRPCHRNSQRKQPCWHLGFRLWTSRAMRDECLLFKSPSLGCFATGPLGYSCAPFGRVAAWAERGHLSPGLAHPSALTVLQVSWGGLEQIISGFSALFPEESARWHVRTPTSSAGWIGLLLRVLLTNFEPLWLDSGLALKQPLQNSFTRHSPSKHCPCLCSNLGAAVVLWTQEELTSSNKQSGLLPISCLDVSGLLSDTAGDEFCNQERNLALHCFVISLDAR